MIDQRPNPTYNTSVKLSLRLEDVTAKADSTFTASNKAAYSDMANLSIEGEYTTPKCATLEKNRWVLDGTWEAFPDEPTQSGYNWGFVSDSIGGSETSEVTTITITLSGYHSARGLTFEFDDYDKQNYPYKLAIEWFKDDEAVCRGVFYPTGRVFATENTVQNYNKIVICVYGTTTAYRYTRIKSIMHGAKKPFEQGEIISAKVLEEISITGAKLPISKLTAKVYSPNDDFNLLNPNGLYSLIQSRQPLDVQLTYNDTTVDFNRYYIDTVETNTDKTLTISAVDAIGVMDKTEFKGNIYAGVSATTILGDILEDAGFKHSLSISDTSLTGYIDICSHREALQKVLFAIGAYASGMRGNSPTFGAVAIKPLPTVDSTSGTTSTYKLRFTGTSLKLNELYTGVTVKEYTYSLAVDSWGEAKTSTLYSGALKAGNNYITLKSPASEITTTSGTITETGVNYIVINSTSAVSSCRVTGRTYEDETQEITITPDVIPAGTQENIASANCTLVSASNSEQVGLRYLDALNNRLEWEIKTLYYWNNFHTGQVVTMQTKEGYTRKAIVESVEIDLAGGLVTEVTLKGAV